VRLFIWGKWCRICNYSYIAGYESYEIERRFQVVLPQHWPRAIFDLFKTIKNAFGKPKDSKDKFQIAFPLNSLID